MTPWLGDGTLAHLRDVTEWPDVGERYEITGRLGRGGMGVVYAARDRTLDRDVAIKVLDRAGPGSDAARLLQEEARILGRLEHPGIVPIHDAGVLPDGRVFYVMKLVRGARLDAAVDSHTSIAERLELFLRICDAVSFAHARGVVHRDLKPENVMCGQFGEVLVMDWGVAKVLGRADVDNDVVVGTPGFMPPEQARGESELTDVRADVYALGALLESLLVPPIPKRLTAIARKAQSEHMSDRYATAGLLADDIGRFRDGEPVTAYRESIFERLGRVYLRYRVPILLVLVYMVMRAILVLWWRD